jgi:hypothetical protein
MPTILGRASCGDLTNTGSAGCNIIPTLINRAVAIPKGYVIPASELTDEGTFATAFQAYFDKKDSRTTRFYMSPLLTNIDLKGGDEVTESRDNYDFTVQFKPYNWSWLQNPSGMNICDYKNWRKIANQTQGLYDWLFIDDSGQVWGTSKADTTGAAGLGGYSAAESVVAPWMPKTASALPKFPFRLLFQNNEEIIGRSEFVQANVFPPNNGWGLIGVTLAAGTTPNTATHTYVSGTFGCGADDLMAAYGDILADPTAWVATDNGSALVISAIAVDPINKQMNLTHASVTSGHTVTVKLAAPSVLNATPFFLNLISETAYSYVQA